MSLSSAKTATAYPRSQVGGASRERTVAGLGVSQDMSIDTTRSRKATDSPSIDNDRPVRVPTHAAARWDERTGPDSASPERACERAIRLAGYHGVEWEWPDLGVRFDPATATVLLIEHDTPGACAPALVTVLRHEQLFQNQAAYVGAGVRDRVADALAEWQGDDAEALRASGGRVELGGGA